MLVCCQGFLLTLHLSVLFMVHYLWFPNLPKWTCFTENNFSELPFNCTSLIVSVCMCLIFADLIDFSWYCYSSLCLFLILLIFWNLRFLLHSWLLLVLQQDLQKLECCNILMQWQSCHYSVESYCYSQAHLCIPFTLSASESLYFL